MASSPIFSPGAFIPELIASISCWLFICSVACNNWLNSVHQDGTTMLTALFILGLPLIHIGICHSASVTWPNPCKKRTICNLAGFGATTMQVYRMLDANSFDNKFLWTLYVWCSGVLVDLAMGIWFGLVILLDWARRHVGSRRTEMAV